MWGRVIFGRKGSGKTSLVKAIISAPRCPPRVLIVDTLREYGGSLAVEVGSGAELADYLRRSPDRFRVAYFNARLEEDFPALCEAVWGIGDILFIVEETDWFTRPAWIGEEFSRLHRYGRHRRVQTVCVSRRPTSEMHPIIRSAAYEMYAFAVDEPADYDYLRRKVSPEFAEEAKTLPVLECLKVNLVDRTQPYERLRVAPGGGGITVIERWSDEEPEPEEVEDAGDPSGPPAPDDPDGGDDGDGEPDD